jgi:hypothetical protein
MECEGDGCCGVVDSRPPQREEAFEFFEIEILYKNRNTLVGSSHRGIHHDFALAVGIHSATHRIGRGAHASPEEQTRSVNHR